MSSRHAPKWIPDLERATAFSPEVVSSSSRHGFQPARVSSLMADRRCPQACQPRPSCTPQVAPKNRIIKWPVLRILSSATPFSLFDLPLLVVDPGNTSAARRPQGGGDLKHPLSSFILSYHVLPSNLPHRTSPTHARLRYRRVPCEWTFAREGFCVEGVWKKCDERLQASALYRSLHPEVGKRAHVLIRGILERPTTMKRDMCVLVNALNRSASG